MTLLRRWLFALVLTVALLAEATPAAACSAGPDFDPRAATDLVVAGSVTALEISPAANQSGYHRATVTISVATVLRGAVTMNVLRFVDDASVVLEPGPQAEQVRFFGASGGCGVLDADPVGRYVVIALKRSADGELHANRLYGAAFGTGPTDPALQWVLERQRVMLPSTGTSGAGSAVPVPDPVSAAPQVAAGPAAPAAEDGWAAPPVAVITLVIVASAAILYPRVRGRAP